jgi:hypothetical protein
MSIGEVHREEELRRQGVHRSELLNVRLHESATLLLLQRMLPRSAQKIPRILSQHCAARRGDNILVLRE